MKKDQYIYTITIEGGASSFYYYVLSRKKKDVYLSHWEELIRYSCYEYRAVELMKAAYPEEKILSWQDVPFVHNLWFLSYFFEKKNKMSGEEWLEIRRRQDEAEKMLEKKMGA